MPLIDFPREECRCFFKKLLSFPNSAFSRWRRRSSSIISSWDFSSSLFWHSSRYERTQLETVALDRPYSTTRLQSCVHPECAHEQLFVWFCLIFESSAFLLCWHYNLSDRGVTNSLYHYNPYIISSVRHLRMQSEREVEPTYLLVLTKRDFFLICSRIRRSKIYRAGLSISPGNPISTVHWRNNFSLSQLILQSSLHIYLSLSFPDLYI